MKNFLKIIPIPICGLILGLASLGNLFKDYHHVALGNLTGGISMILMIFILLNCLSYSNTRNKRCMIQSSPPFHQLLRCHSWLFVLILFHMKVLHQLSNSFGCALLSSK